MSLALKQQTEINLFTSVVYHISFCAFLTLLVIRNAILAINIVVYVIGNTLSKLIKQFIMIATERSESIAKWGLVIVDTLLFYAIDYIDVEQSKTISSEQNLRTFWEKATKKQQISRAPTKKGVAGVIAAPKSPVVSPEIIKKTEAVRRNDSKSINKPTEASPVLSMFSELSLRKAAKNQLPLEQRSCPCIPSSLGQNRPKDGKPSDFCPSKRHSTPASEKPKRTTTMKFLNSTAANRVMRRKKQRQDDQDEIKQQKKLASKQNQVKPELKDKNLNLFDERPLLSQPARTHNLNQTPQASLQASRKYIKFMIKVRKHRSTI